MGLVDSLADAIARHELDVEFVGLRVSGDGLSARVAWPWPNGTRVEHDELMLLAERRGLRRALQAWLLQACACQIALRTRAGTAVPIVLQARRGDFGRLDIEWTTVRWGIDAELLQVPLERTVLPVAAAA